MDNGVSSVLVLGKKELLEHVLFESALYCATEFGLNIWFISPHSFSRLPHSLIPPDKDMLKLITFLYLKDQRDLLNHLNGIHLWHKFPQAIILSGFEHYVSDKCSPMNVAFIMASVLDAIISCMHRHPSKKAYLVVSCDSKVGNLEKISNLYFNNFLFCTDAKCTLECIKKCFNKASGK